MTESGTRSFRELAESTNAPLAPVQASDEQLRQMAKGEHLTVLAVDAKDNEEFGTVWEYTVKRPTGEMLLFGLWANPQRDLTATTLMTFCQDGPVDDVLLENRGSDKKPFWVIVPA